jgi:glycosyltransferase involved in cell wall biosynthesis
MEDDKNFRSQYSQYFVRPIDYKDSNPFNKIKNGLRVIYSFEAYRKLTELIKATRPDIAHVNLFCHQLTPSIFRVLKKAGIPVIYTSHDYKLVCPNYKLLSHDRICKKCINGSFYHCFLQKCHKGSRAASCIVTLESYIHRTLKTYSMVTKIICPSQFMRNILIEAGFDERKLATLPNFLKKDVYDRMFYTKRVKKENTLLYFGRLSDEKGLETLLDARRFIPENIKIKVIGTGPTEEYIKTRITYEGLKNIELKGFVSGDELYYEIAIAKCTIIPSKCYEIFGLTIIESFALGTPVVGSDTGGISELIFPGVNGYLFQAGDPDDLSQKVKAVFSMLEDDYQTMVDNCISEAKKYCPDSYYNELMTLYKGVLSNDAVECKYN